MTPAVRNVLLVGVGVAAAIALLIAARFALAPKPFQPYFTLRTVHGMSTGEAERTVAVPLELAAMRLEGVSGVRTHVDANAVEITVETRPGVPIDGVVFPAIEKLSAVQTDAVPPEVISVREKPHLIYLSLSSDQLTATQLHELAEKRLRWELLRTPGVRDVELCGPGLPGVMITVDPQRLGGSITDLVDAIRSAKVMGPAGVLDGSRQNFVIRAGGGDLEGLRQLELGGGRRLTDVATLSEQPVDLPCIGSRNGMRAVGLLVRASTEVPMPSAASLPASVKLQTLKFDRVLHFATSGSPMALEKELTVLREHPAIADVAYEIRSAGNASVATAYVAINQDHRQSLMKFPLQLPLTRIEGEALREVAVAGPELDALNRAAAAVKDALEKQGFEVLSSAPPDAPWTQIELDREALARMSVNASEVTDTLKLISDRGMEVSTIHTPDGPRPVHLQLPGHNLEDLATVRVGKGVPLAAVAKVTLKSEPAWIDRQDGQRVIRLQTSASKAQIVEASKALQLPAGIALTLPR